MPAEIMEVRYLLSNIYSAWRQMAKAEEQLEQILKTDPASATANNDLGYIWADNDKNLRDKLTPVLDRTVSALLEDLKQRGLLESTVVIVTGEFGRTPVVNPNRGRDHWPDCWSMVLGGGGIQGGQIVGASDAQGTYVTDRPVSPKDILATTYHLLGIDPETLLHDRLGRPVSLVPGGSVVSEMLA